MNCKQSEKWISEFYESQLSNQQAEQLKKHLNGCKDCSGLFDDYDMIINSLSSLPNVESPKEIKSSFLHELNRPKVIDLKPTEPKRRSSKIQALQIAASFVLFFMIGFFAKDLMNDNRIENYISELKTENETLKNNMVLALLENQSPSMRIKAIDIYEKNDVRNDEIIKVLLDKMNNDSNDNVRMAAIKSISKFISFSEIKKEFIQQLKKEKNPNIQILIIEALSNIKEIEIINAMKYLKNRQDVEEYVKVEANRTLKSII